MAAPKGYRLARHRWRAFLFGVALALVAVSGAAAAPDPAAPSWTQEQVAAEWAAIQAAHPEIRTPQFVATEEKRAWLHCAARWGSSCLVYEIHLPQMPWSTGLRDTLWHEAGHLTHFAHPPDWDAYRRLRRITPWALHLAGVYWQINYDPTYEYWAEDWRRCFGPPDGAPHAVWWAGEPPQAVCEWLKAG